MPEDNVAQENTPVNLPADCIYEIIQYIVNDIKTLYSCIILNQTFCQVAIRALWSNPFKYVKDESKRGLIFRTYFSCLNDEEKNQITTFLHKTVLDFPRPFINYPGYLQEFEIYNIQTSMRTFLRHYYSVSPTENRINSIVRILNPFMERLLFNNQSNFKYVNVDLNRQITIEKNQIDMSSFDSEILKQVLSNIKKFSFVFNSVRFDVKKLEFLKFIQRNATILTNIISVHNKDIQHVRFLTPPYMRENKLQKLKKLNAECDNLLETLKSFILSLNNLKSIETNCFSRSKDFSNLFKKHSHSLTFLKICEVFNSSVVLNIIDHCPNLKTIELSSFVFNNNTDINSIILFDKPITSSLNYLKNFHITIPYPSVLKLFERIILMSNNNLKTLHYGRQDTYHLFSNFNNVVSSIQPFCSNLTHLFIRIINEREFPSNILFLKSLQRLIHLKLSCNNSFKDDNIAELARSFPSTLQILEMDSIIMVEKLKILFQNLQCNLREISIDARINDAVLRIIIDYASQKNSLTKFRHLNSKNTYFQLSPQVLEEAKDLFIVDDNAEQCTSFINSIF